MLEFIKEKSIQKGYAICYYCLNQDEYFGLSGECSNCHKALPKQNKLKSFLLSLEIINEFVKTVDDILETGVREQISNHLHLVIDEIIKYDSFPKRERINSLRVILADIGFIGSKEHQIAIEAKKGNVKLLLSKSSDGYFKELILISGIVVLSFNYIIEYLKETCGD